MYRPDIKYIQGMSYLMTMLLLFFPPYKAFKYFCNLVLTKRYLYKTYLFKKKYLNKINFVLEHTVSKYYPKLYGFLKNAKMEIWNIFWVEWVYAMFLRTFDLKTSVRLWDVMLLKGEIFIFKLNYVVFGLLDENFGKMNKDNFFDEAKRLIFRSYEEILTRCSTDINHEFDFFYIQNIMKTEKI